MLPGAALYRLLWRPAILMWGTLGALLTTALLQAGSQADWQRAIHGNLLTPERRDAVLTAMYLVAALSGFLLGRAQKELQHRLFSWSLPGLRRQLFLGLIPPLLLVIALAGVVGAWLGGGSSAVTLGVMAFLVSTASLAAWDRWPSELLSYLMIVLLVLGGWRASELFAWAASAPWVTALGTVLGGALLARAASARAARLRPFLPTWPLGTGGERDWARDRIAFTRPSPRRWRLRPDPTRLLEWIRAAEYEAYGRYRFGWSSAAVVLAGGAALAVWLWADHEREIISICTVAAVAHHGVRSIFLRRTVPHPLSRSRRATVTWWTGLCSNALFCLLLGAFLLAAVHLPPPSPFGAMGLLLTDAPLRFLPFLFALVPAMQWVQGVWLSGESGRGGTVGGVTVFVVVIVLVQVAVMLPSRRLEGTALALGALATALVVHTAFRLGLERFYRTADLV